MTLKTVFIKTLAATGVLAMSLAVSASPSWAKSGVSSADTDGDGSVTLQEAHDAAARKFDKLDAAHTGKLTEKQVPPMEKAIREMARHDKDHAVDKTEYMAGVDAAFKEADPKGSGVLDARALKTKAGKRFRELVE